MTNLDRRDLLEMAMRPYKDKESAKGQKGQGGPYAIPLDEYDLEYLKHIVPKGWAVVKGDKIEITQPKKLRDLWNNAIRKRYNDLPKLSNIGATKKMDLQFTVMGVGRLNFPDVPVNGAQLTEKLHDHGWNYSHEKFGMSKGTFNTVDFGKQMIAIWTGQQSHFPYWHPSYSTTALHYDPEKDDNSERGYGKWRQRQEVGEMDEKVLKPINLDQHDYEYLQSFLKQSEEDKDFPLFAPLRGGSIDEYESYAPQALARRYSDYFIKKNEDGEFVIDPRFLNAQDQPVKYGPVPIREHGKVKYIQNVKLNLPELLEKFKKIKQEVKMDFVKNPMVSDSIQDKDRFRTGINSARRWLANKAYTPFQGAYGGAVNIDQDKLNRLIRDHESYRKDHKPEPVSPEDAQKYPWRSADGKKIEESPNINDVFQGRDANKYTWEQLVRDDCRIGVQQALKMFAQKFSGHRDAFSSKYGKNSVDLENLLNDTFAHVFYNRSGDENYRYESRRSTWARKYAEKKIDEDLRKMQQSIDVADKSGKPSANQIADKSQGTGVASDEGIVDYVDRIFEDPEALGYEKVVDKGVEYVVIQPAGGLPKRFTKQQLVNLMKAQMQ